MNISYMYILHSPFLFPSVTQHLRPCSFVRSIIAFYLSLSMNFVSWYFIGFSAFFVHTCCFFQANTLIYTNTQLQKVFFLQKCESERDKRIHIFLHKRVQLATTSNDNELICDFSRRCCFFSSFSSIFSAPNELNQNRSGSLAFNSPATAIRTPNHRPLLETFLSFRNIEKKLKFYRSFVYSFRECCLYMLSEATNPLQMQREMY